MTKAARGIEMKSDTHRFTFPPDWAVEVSRQGVVFLGPNGETATVSSSPLNLPSRTEPLANRSGVIRNESAGADGSMVVDLVARGPAPEITLHCVSPEGATESLDRLAKALEQTEWFPPADARKRWWRFW